MNYFILIMQPWKISVQIMSFKLSLISSHSKRKKKWVEINSSDIEIFYYSENSLESHVMKHLYRKLSSLMNYIKQTHSDWKSNAHTFLKLTAARIDQRPNCAFDCSKFSPKSPTISCMERRNIIIFKNVILSLTA